MSCFAPGEQFVRNGEIQSRNGRKTYEKKRIRGRIEGELQRGEGQAERRKEQEGNEKELGEER